MSEQEPRRARHLIDPTAPRPRTDPADLERLRRVQRWVLSVLVVTTIGHLAAGLVIAGLVVPEDRPDARIGLVVLGTVCGVLAVAAGRAIHGARLVSPWLLLGLLPGVVGGALIASGSGL